MVATPSEAFTPAPLAESMQGAEHALHCVLTSQYAVGQAGATHSSTVVGRVLSSHRAGSTETVGALIEEHTTARAAYPKLLTPHGALHEDHGEI